MEISVSDRIRICVNSKLESANQDRQTYVQKFGRDFVQFFEWYSGDLYKTELFIDQVFKLKKIIDDCQGEVFPDVVNYLHANVEKVENELFNRNARVMSMSPMDNIAYTLKMEVNQMLRQFYNELLTMIK